MTVEFSSQNGSPDTVGLHLWTAERNNSTFSENIIYKLRHYKNILKTKAETIDQYKIHAKRKIKQSLTS